MTKPKNSSLKWILDVHNRLVQHVKNQTTDLAPAAAVQATRAGDIYFSGNRDKVATMEYSPSFIMPSCLLPRGHVVVANPPTTVNDPEKRTPSVIVYRDPTTDTVKAFLNQCRHRGAELVPPETATLTRPRKLNGPFLVCPYHAWSYQASTGDLKRVPGETIGFPCLEKDLLGLQEVVCQQRVGGIWVGGDPALTTEFSLTKMDDELGDLWLEPVAKDDDNNEKQIERLVGFRQWNLEANWQILVETFLESYHVQYLHQKTLGQVTHGNRMVVDRIDGRSLRHTVPLTNLDSHALSEDDKHVVSPSHDFFSQTTTTCFAFPNVAISLFKRFALMVSIVPTSNTTSLVRAFGITHHTAKGEPLEKQQRDFANVLHGVEEDWACAEGIQRGLTPETLVHHGRFEGNNQFFLRNVGEVLLVKK